MTALVSVQTAGAMTRLRRYEARGRERPVCTHEGAYDPETVTHTNLHAYIARGPAQDRRGFTCYECAATLQA